MVKLCVECRRQLSWEAIGLPRVTPEEVFSVWKKKKEAA